MNFYSTNTDALYSQIKSSFCYIVNVYYSWHIEIINKVYKDILSNIKYTNLTKLKHFLIHNFII